MPTEREWRRIDRDRADADLILRAVKWLREDPGRAVTAGLADDRDAEALAVLLEILAVELAHLDPAVRWQTIECCRVLLGEPRTSPRIRRTRRR